MTVPRLVVRTEHYTEGVVVAPDGTIFFSMTASGVIVSMHPDASGGEIWAHVPAANGHAIDDDGTHVVISSAGSILRLDKSGRTIDVVASQVDDRWLIYPNDVTLDSHRGGYFITDSGYKTMPNSMPPELQGRVYRVDVNKRVREVADGLAYANGIALSGDGTRLYVGESVTGRIWTYPVKDDGALGARVLYTETPKSSGDQTAPDGIMVSAEERLFVAHYGAREILVYEPDGTLVERLPAGNKATSHAAIAPDHRTLYVSGGIEDEAGPGAIFAIDLTTSACGNTYDGRRWPS